MAETGGDVIGLDWRVRLDEGWERVGHDRGVQGNLDPALLLGPFERVESAAIAILDAAGGRPGHIFNLGHGVLPDTDPADLKRHRRARPRTDRRMKPAVVLMAYGSPSDLADIRPYLEDIRSGRPVSDEAVEELTERYRRIGGRSPLDDVTEGTRAGARARARLPGLRGHEALDAEDRRGRRPGRRGRRRPDRRARARAALLEALDRRLPRAARGRARRARRTAVHRELARARAVPGRARRSRARRPTRMSSSRRTAFRRGSSTWATRIATSCSETSQLIAERAGLESWSFAFQSASATGEPWLGPDILEELDSLARSAASSACSSARSASSATTSRSCGTSTSRRGSARPSSGLELDRIESLNDDPAFVRGLGRAVSARPLEYPRPR